MTQISHMWFDGCMPGKNMTVQYKVGLAGIMFARKCVQAALGALLVILMTACASNRQPDVLDFGTGSVDQVSGQREISQATWPDISSGEIARYAYAGELYGEGNFRRAKGESKTLGENLVAALRWLVGLVVGDDELIFLQRPQSGVVDMLGQRILITDTNRQAVYVFDQKAGRVNLWEGASEHDNFIAPAGITLGAASDIYVADAELGYVARLDHDGKSLGVIGRGELKRPIGLAFDRATQQLFVADVHAHDIKVFNADGQLLRTLGNRGEEPGEFNFPTFLALAQGELYVTDTMNARIQVLDAATGKSRRIIGKRGLNMGDLVRPKGVAVDSEGNVYVVESYHDYLLVFNPKGEFLIPIGGTGQGVGQFYLPTSVWADADNRIFVADMFNGRVQLFQFLGGATPNRLTGALGNSSVVPVKREAQNSTKAPQP